MIAFSGNPLDRASEKRSDAAWLAAARGDARARVLPLWKLQPLLEGPESAAETQLAFLDGVQTAKLCGETLEIFLGRDGEVLYFARDISAEADPLAVLGGGFHFREARAAAAHLPARDVAILGQAKALIDWHARHGYCARCGAATAPSDAGYKRICPVCKTEHFPRTDPAVIMLVHAGDRCLLARNKRFVGGHYSTLAGFVEPGETIEEAVRREVFEEVGIRIGRVEYFASQPWPFPSSLMIGCFAEAETCDIVVDGEEIVTARWVERSLAKKILSGESTEIGLPRRDAIAHHLVRTWAERA